MDAAADDAFGAQIVAVGADRDGIEGLSRARRAGLPTFVVKLSDHPTRAAWDEALHAAIAAYEPDLVVSAGFMKLLGPKVLERFPNRIVNTHPALLPAFPGKDPVRDTLAYGVKVTGVTVHFVDAGTDTGPVIAQLEVPVEVDDDEDSLTARIQAAEKPFYVEAIRQLCQEIAP